MKSFPHCPNFFEYLTYDAFHSCCTSSNLHFSIKVTMRILVQSCSSKWFQKSYTLKTPMFMNPHKNIVVL